MTKTTISAVSILVWMTVYTSQAQVADWRSKSTEISQFLENQESKGFSGQVLISDQNEIWLNRGYGYADRESKRKIDKESVFSIGSITKDYTRAAIFSLVEQGKLELNDQLEELFVNVPSDKKKITIQQLLDMQAGLIDYVPNTIGDFHEIGRDEAKRRILDAKLLFDPGTSQRYSNSGYILLAMIVEDKSGLTYEEFLGKFLFPKSITRHGFFGSDEWSEKQTVAGYDNLKNGDKNSPYYWKTTWVLRGSGGIVTSAQGLYEWKKAMRSGRVLGKKGTELYFKRRTEARAGQMLVVAGGDDLGFTSVLVETVGAGLTLVINSNTANFDAESILRDLMDIVRGEEPNQPIILDENSPQVKRLVEFLSVLESGDFNTYLDEAFTDAFVQDLGKSELLGFLNQVRQKHGGFKRIKPLNSSQNTMKILVEGIQSKEERVLILEFDQRSLFRIDALGLAPYNGQEESVGDADAKNKLDAFLTVLTKGEMALKKFIKEEFTTEFLEDFGLETHYNFLKVFDKGFEQLEVLQNSKRSVRVSAKNLKNQELLEISLEITDDGKIDGIGFEN